jgi:O-antigen/teichoic acid export membrane protein
VRLAVNTAANVFGVALPGLAALLAIPLIVRDLGVTLFGYFSLQLALLYLLGLADLGIARTIVLSARKDPERSEDAWPHAYFSGLHYTTRISAVVAALGLLWALGIWLALDDLTLRFDLAVSTFFTVLAACLTLLSLPSRAALEIQDRFFVMNIIRGSSSAALFLVPLVVLQFSKNLSSIAVAILIVRLVALLAFRRSTGLPGTIWSASQPTNSLAHRQQFLKRLGWIGLTNTVSPLLGYLDRIAIGYILSAASVGVYTLAQEIVSKVSLLIGAGSTAWLPRLVFLRREWRGKEFQNLVSRSIAFVFFLGCVPCLVLVLCSDIILKVWLRDAFQAEAVLPMQILAVGMGINSLSQVNFSVLQVLGGERDCATLQLIQIPLLTALLVALIPSFGIVGAALAIAFRLLIDGAILRLMLARHCGGSMAPGVKLPYIVLAAVVGAFVVYEFADWSTRAS